MTIHGTELAVILSAIVLGLVIQYLLVLRRVRQMVAERQLTLADQLAKLDDAIRALETRLAEHHAGSETNIQQTAGSTGSDRDSSREEQAGEEIPADIKAAIAAAAVAVAGANVQVRSVKPVSATAASAWTQQGRVMVQGSHNLRVRR